MAGLISARDDGIPEWPARRPGRLDRADARLVQARCRPQLQCRDFRIYPHDGREARQAEATSGRLVRLRAPAGVGAVQTLSGLHRNVTADGTVEISGSDAIPLLGTGWVKVDVSDLPK
jgi:hypothetical protein